MLKMLSNLVNRFSEREVRRYRGVVAKVNALEPEIAALTDEQLRAKTAEFKERASSGESLDKLLPEAFAVVREGSKRVLKMRHFDVQLIGGMVLHDGRIAEMRTGEGKTLVATLAAYLNAVAGKGVHVVTVNDYLARRDAQWMGQLYQFLGLTVGLIQHDMEPDERRQAYAADITYGTNNEFGFDYLRDNMVSTVDEMVQRPLHYAIVDEVDSILIDEARTPLIISGQADKSPDLYYQFARIASNLREEKDYTIDEKLKAVAPTEEGVAKVERMLGVANLYDDVNIDLSHYLNQALRAKALMKRDRDYVVKDGEVIIVDEFTGRLMFGRRYSDGLHQAIEAKEGVPIQDETQTLATITFQNYFRMYHKLSGMTGTAITEEEEFRKIYGLDVIVVPTNKPLIRKDFPDVVYKTEAAKFRAVVREIEALYKERRPILVGTVSIEKSERLSEMLKAKGVPHTVLNAKYHEQEAEIIAQAGQAGAVTIATNMAGRGTDIVLGEGVAEMGGLHIIGTERHESRRIDNQLRGRAGRQGDPGSSRFYLSLEDDFLRLFAAQTLSNLMDRLGVEEDEPIESPMLSRAIESAQKKVEARNFDARKQVLQYDDVMNLQREVIYKQRKDILSKENLREDIMHMLSELVDDALAVHCPANLHPDEWELQPLLDSLHEIFLPEGMVRVEDLEGKEREEMQQVLVEAGTRAYEQKEQEFGEEAVRELERMILLRVVDSKWMEHLDAMDNLREGVGLRAYGQQDPLVEYKKEAYDMYQNMLGAIREEVIRMMFHLQLAPQQPIPTLEPVATVTDQEPHRPFQVIQGGQGTKPPKEGQGRQLGRNDPCWCGSGKKYKKCHGADQETQ
ncbi:preprotein translocase subunit SecA [Sulfobacillus sp. hq2]|uniref:preprotein translocase subunit SecA n=1 Tax=Sulfobacillus TaxID=28033 RepID=UPI000CD014DB|nr:preprotein translocase subunit SecA [Sulfobacillus sp. hq2]POB09738.1 preprotein translocase subunit SecA [Sulfobacillus sp. hq2]